GDGSRHCRLRGTLQLQLVQALLGCVLASEQLLVAAVEILLGRVALACSGSCAGLGRRSS
ncbi:MAG TPA: hypothetical protein VGM29_15335, partial [Polyangiaceae bacterium]